MHYQVITAFSILRTKIIVCLFVLVVRNFMTINKYPPNNYFVVGCSGICHEIGSICVGTVK